MTANQSPPARPDRDALRIALEPFAKLADDYEASEQRRIRTYADEGRAPGAKLPDSHRVSISLGDCRNAKLAMSIPARDAAEVHPTADDIRACARSTLIGFQQELGDANIEFICDQIARKVTMPQLPQASVDVQS
jgi:hypothetical protein